MRDPWALHISQSVARFIYTLPRGQATSLRDALATLRMNSHPEGTALLTVTELPNLFEATVGGFCIQFQVLAEQRVIRVLFVE